MAHTDTTTATLAAIDQFNHLVTSYKTVGEHEVLAHVLVPKTALSSTPVPIFVNFHGGGLITGDAMTIQWLTSWNFDLPYSQSAILIHPNYRLLPEANGTDLLADLSDFWTWVSTDLQSYLDKHSPVPITADLSNIIPIGGSAGGYFAVQTGFISLPPSLTIRGIIASYPMLDLEDDWYNVPDYKVSEKFVTLQSMPFFKIFPKQFLDEYLEKMRQHNPVPPVSTSEAPERVALMLATFQNGYYKQFLKGDSSEDPRDECYPLRMAKKATKFPPILILHGLGDSAVPVQGTNKFVKVLRESIPDVQVRVELHEGDHGFDQGLELGKGWFGEAIEWFKSKVLA